MSPKPVRTLNIYDKGTNYLILDSDEITPLYNIHWNGSSAPHMTVTRPLDPEPKPIVGTATYHAQKIGGFFSSASKITLKVQNRVVPLNKSGNVFSLNKRSLESISGQTLYWKGGVAASGFLKLVDGNGEIVAKYENRAYSGDKMGVFDIMREMNEESVDEIVVSGCATISEEKTSMTGTATAISSAGGSM